MNLELEKIKLRQMYQAIKVKIDTPINSVDYFYKDVINLVISEPLPNVLSEILKLPLNNSFPTGSITAITQKHTGELDESSTLSANLNYYWSSIAGVISCIIKGRICNSSQEAREILQTTFFESHKAYRNFKEASKEFNDLHSEIIIFEKAKMLGLIYITLIDRKSFNMKSEEQ